MQRAPLHEALGWLNYATAPAAVGEVDGIPRVRAPSLSAGALASTAPVLLSRRGMPRLFRPQPTNDVAVQLEVSNPEPLKLLRGRVDDLLPGAQACDIVVLLSNVARLDAVYETSQSLAWRDAGAMLQTLALTATAFGLGLCPLGLLGSEVVQALALPDDVQAVGLSVIGI